MKRLFPRLPVFTALALLTLAACQPQKNSTAAQGIETYYSIQMGDQELALQIAITPQEKSQGLMHRDPLEPKHGMLFIFPDVGQRSFWMRNTKIPLDLGYLDASGKLIEIHSLYPYDETPVPSRSREIMMALELNQGSFKALQLSAGAQLNLDKLKDAIEARGHTVDNYPFK